jgi:hypothetical protein
MTRVTMQVSSTARPQPRESASMSTDESSRKLTPSSRASQSSDGPSSNHELNSFELRPITPRNDSAAREREGDDECLLPRASVDSAQSYELYTPDEDRAVLRKLDRRLVSFMAMLYCLSFLDRSSE